MKMTSEQYKAERDAIRYNFNLGWKEKQEMLDNLWMTYCDGLETGDKANVKLWTDVQPCTVIKRTAKTVTVRYDKGSLDPKWKPEMVVGGFSAYTTNNDDQKWVLEDDLNGRTEVFRRRKDGWFNTSDCRLAPGWHKFHDYNF